MLSTARWKCETDLASETSLAVLPKKVLVPVSVTRATISPCLATEPE